MLDAGRTWIKLSGAYFDSAVGAAGAAGGYADATRVVRHWVATAPERLVWGSDWPHPTEAHKPDDAQLLDLMQHWADSDATRERILVDNPAQLYDFSPAMPCKPLVDALHMAALPVRRIHQRYWAHYKS